MELWNRTVSSSSRFEGVVGFSFGGVKLQLPGGTWSRDLRENEAGRNVGNGVGIKSGLLKTFAGRETARVDRSKWVV